MKVCFTHKNKITPDIQTDRERKTDRQTYSSRDSPRSEQVSGSHVTPCYTMVDELLSGTPVHVLEIAVRHDLRVVIYIVVMCDSLNV